jgi:hypothetical protein
MRTLAIWSGLGLVLAVLACGGGGDALQSRAGAIQATRTGWQMHNGLEVTAANPLGLIAFTCLPAMHGDVCEYAVATIPSQVDPGWGPAPDPDIINFSVYPSRVCSAPVACNVFGDFTYFQTLVDVPANVAVTEFTIAFDGMDDGSRVTIFNSSYPGGLVVPGSYVFLWGTGTADLSPYVRSGQVNRVVVTQVDDCCSENNLRSAAVVLNGQVVHTGCDTDADCGDGDACTTDTCNPDGSCSHPAVGCDDGDSCTADSCDPQAGCGHAAQCPDCSSAGPTVGQIWPPNHKLVSVGVQGVTDPQGQPLSIVIDGIRQDEPTNACGDGNTCPDASGVGTSTARVRAERTGTPQAPGDGRVYHLSFTATDPDGHSCSGTVSACVPHDQGAHSTCVDQGPLYDSLTCGP